MGEFRDNISTQLSKCEEIYESIDNLLEGLEHLREHGGTAKFILYPNDGHKCESLITEKTAEEFLLFPIFWLILIGHQLAEKWRKWVTK